MKIICTALTLASVSVCWAQFSVQIRSAGPLPGGPFSDQVVTGKPFTAEAVFERNQILADGNQISNKQTSTIARDSQGRTRREETMPLPSDNGQTVKTVFISDPVAKVNYVLGPDKIAHKFPYSNPGYNQVAHSEQAVASKQKVILGAAEAEETGMVLALSSRDSGEKSEESLGMQDVNGVQAMGTQTTITIPAGEVGNEAPLVVTHERWYSQDLQTLIKSQEKDPRFGETSFQLTNIQRSEPEASMFQVPSDYTIQDAPLKTPPPR